MKEKNNRLWGLLPAFLIPALCFIAVLYHNGIIPFGSENAFFYIDMNYQYISYFSYLKQMLTGDVSASFTFAKLIGGDMAGLTAYYLISPFNLLFLLFDTADMATAVSVVAICKIGCAGLCAYIFFSHHLNDRAKSLILSTGYALMAYMIVYIQNIMWIDGVIMLPLIALGIDYIYENRSCALYIFSLFLGIFFNYYIGFMLCGASVLYFAYRFAVNKTAFREKFGYMVKYAVSSILGGGMSAFVILPVLKSLEGTTKTEYSFFESIGLQTQLRFRELIKHLLVPDPVMYNIEIFRPSVFAGFVVTLLFIGFFLLPKIPFSKKIAGGIITVIMLASFYFKTLYLLWHGLSKPVCFEYRFAFVGGFFVLLFAMEFLAAVKLKRLLLFALLAVNALSSMWYINLNYDGLNFEGLDFKDYYNSTKPVIDHVKELEKDSDDFYRIEKDFRYNYNDAMAFGYNGLSHYSSGEKLVTRDILAAAGYSYTEMYGYYGYGSNISNDAMMGIKYLLYKDTYRDGLKEISVLDDVTVYENPYAFPLAFKADSAVCDLAVNDVRRCFAADTLIESAWGKNYSMVGEITDYTVTLDNVETYTNEEGRLCYRIIEGKKGFIDFTFTAPCSSNLYTAVIIDGKLGKIKYINCKDTELKYYPDYYDHATRLLCQMEEGETITVHFDIRGDLEAKDLMFVYDDFSALETFNTDMAKNRFEDDRFDGDSFTVSGTMDSTEGIVIMAPPVEGWKYTVNGEKAEMHSVLSNFVYLDVPEGDFVIEAKFTTPGLAIGLAISAVCLAAAAGFLWFEKKSFRR